MESRPLLFVLRGLPGSGKTYLAQEIVKEAGKGLIVSADDFFIGDDGVYRYDRTKIKKAHQVAQETAREAMKSAVTPLVIDNTHTQFWECKPYVQAAVQKGYLVVFKEPSTPWAKDPVQCAKRTVHKVPLTAIRTLANRWQDGISVDAVLKNRK